MNTPPINSPTPYLVSFPSLQEPIVGSGSSKGTSSYLPDHLSNQRNVSSRVMTGMLLDDVTTYVIEKGKNAAEVLIDDLKTCALQAAVTDATPAFVLSGGSLAAIRSAVVGRMATCMIRCNGGREIDYLMPPAEDGSRNAASLTSHFLVGALGGALKYKISGNNPKIGALNNGLNQVIGKFTENEDNKARTEVIAITSTGTIEMLDVLVGYTFFDRSNGFWGPLAKGIKSAIVVDTAVTAYIAMQNNSSLGGYIANCFVDSKAQMDSKGV